MSNDDKCLLIIIGAVVFVATLAILCDTFKHCYEINYGPKAKKEAKP